jgi:hypothetical protein
MFDTSISAHIDQLFESVHTLLSDYTGELAWCPITQSKKSHSMLDDIPAGVSVDSEEYHQILRVRLRVDDMVAHACRNISSVIELSGSSLVKLLWSIAVLRMREDAVVGVLQGKLRESMTGLTTDEIVMLVWAEGMLVGDKSCMVELELEDVSMLTLAQLSNLVFAHCLIQGSGSKKFVEANLSGLVKNVSSGSDMVSRHAMRSILFTCSIFELEKPPISRKKSPFTLPAWKYSFQLCLACHGAAAKGVDFNPTIEGCFPFDAMYSSGKKKERLLLEISRPNSNDGYTKLVRLFLSKKSYRTLPISIAEWVALGADFDTQAAYVRMRMSNALRKKRLFSGPEKDFGHEEETEADGADSDMSY